MSDEKTSATVASDAARVLRMSYAELLIFASANPRRLKAIAASALSQAPDAEPPAT